jgi:hypothetical protein
MIVAESDPHDDLPVRAALARSRNLIIDKDRHCYDGKGSHRIVDTGLQILGRKRALS